LLLIYAARQHCLGEYDLLTVNCHLWPIIITHTLTEI
jgi:hypothetical protein